MVGVKIVGGHRLGRPIYASRRVIDALELLRAHGHTCWNRMAETISVTNGQFLGYTAVADPARR